MKNDQNGNKVKLLIFIAVLCVVSLIIAMKIRHKEQVGAMMNEIASLGATISGQSANATEITEKYNRNYALFLHKTGNLPDGLSYAGDAIKAANNARIKATVDANGVVIMEVANLDTESCVRIATVDWGNLQTTRFVGIGIGKAPDFSCLRSNRCKFNYIAAFSGTSDYPFTVDRAIPPCSLFENVGQPASVYLGYQL